MAGERAANKNKNASIIKRRQRVITIVLAWALLVLAAVPTLILWQRIDGIIPFIMVAVLIGYPAVVLILLAIEKIHPAKLLLIFGFWATTTFGAYLSGALFHPSRLVWHPLSCSQAYFSIGGRP